MKSYIRILLAVVLFLAGSIPLTARAESQPGPQEAIVIDAAGRGNPWLNLRDGLALPLPPDLASSQAQPSSTKSMPSGAEGLTTGLSLAAADFDEDGVPDLLATYTLPPVGAGGTEGGHGLLALYRGNLASIYPNAPQDLTDAPFLSPARTFELPATPDFLGAGDFDNDGHRDVVLAARGGNALYLLPGDGQGGFGPAQATELPGAVTALAVGEVNRRDGLADVVVGVAPPLYPPRGREGGKGGQVLVFEGPEGALRAEPEMFAAPAEVSALALGHLDGDYFSDLAIAAGENLLVVHGRDRKLSYHEREPVVDHHALPFAITDLALGNFFVEPDYRLELALLAIDGALHILNPVTAEAMTQSPIHQFTNLPTSNAQLIRAKVSSLPADDLLVLDPTTHQLHVLLNGPTPNVQYPISNPVVLDVTGNPAAVLPLRLNADALSDLVILGEAGPAVSLTAPMSTFTVDSGGDDPDADLGDGVCATASGDCTLRAAIEQANSPASPGADAIEFSVTSVTAHGLPRIVESLTIDGSTGRTELDGSGATEFSPHGLDLFEGGPCVVRGMVINRFAHGAAIRVGGQTGGHIVEGNYLGTDVLGSSPQGNNIGIQVGSASNHTIGGTTEAARNVISGNDTGIWLESTSGTQVQGNYVGTDWLGTSALGNGGPGLLLGMGDNNTIGGTAPGAGNVFAANLGRGVEVHTSGNLIQGNQIGTGRFGFTPLGNHAEGVRFVGACQDNTVGGTADGAGNAIAANELDGIVVGYSSGGVRDNLIRGNTVGTDWDGDVILGNGGNGVAVYARDPNSVRIFGNTIAYNGGDGVWVDDDAHSPIAIQNSIFQNGGLGIDLDPDGPTANDPGDGDEGANRLQNWPEISAISIGTLQTQVTFKVDSSPIKAAYPLLIEFFRADSTASDAEGQTYLGEVYYFESEAQTSVTRSFEPAVGVGEHSRIVATATDAEGNTSEFSRPTSSAGDLVVNSTGDAGDAEPYDGDVCDTGNVLPGGEAECTLRAAIQTANLESGAVLITFDIEGVQGVPTIQPGSALPEITSPVGIDGSTQPDSDMVELDGRNAEAGADGLHITAGSSHVTGLVINHFDGAGIHLQSRGHSVIEGNYIGTDVTGTAILGNKGAGVWIEDSASNTIGGVLASQRNVISGNVSGGVLISGDEARGNQVQGNYIGADVTGEKRLGNGDNGVSITISSNNVIGGTDDGEGNVIAGSEGCGVEISGGLSGESVANNQVLNNYIGTNRNNQACLSLASDPNLGNNIGVCLMAADANAIGASESGNVIGCNAIYGVYLKNSNGNTVAGNRIGVGSSAQEWLGNGLDGVYLEDASNNTIQDNVISGNGSAASYDPNDRNGIRIRHTQFAGSTAAKNVVAANIIGLAADADTALGNQGSGLLIENAARTRVENNIIAANNDHGLEIKGSGAVGTVVWGNKIGLWASGQDTELRNFGHGIIATDAPQMRIADNVISGNEQDGILLRGPAARGMRVEGNLIGVDEDGWTDLGNGNNGISTQAIGYTAIRDNVVAGNDQNGVVISAVGDSLVSSNYIGTYVDGSNLHNEEIGLYLLSQNWHIVNNRVWFNCTDVLDLGQDNVYENNSFRKGRCATTGFFCDGCTATLTGNEIAEDVGDGIKCANGGDPLVRDNNIVDNAGYGLNNLDGSVTIAAQENWWGAADGPGGAGPGSGDSVSDHVDYANWRGESVSLMAAVADDPLLAAPGTTVSTTLFFQNWADPADTLDVTAADSQGWLLPPLASTVVLSDGLGAALVVSFTLPGGAPLGATDDVTVTATSQADPSDAADVTFQVMAVESADLAVVQAASTGTVALDQQIVYTLTISNAGPAAATGVVVTDILPAEVDLVSAVASQGTCAAATDVMGDAVVCDVGALGSGAAATVAVAVTLAERPAGGEIVNYAQVRGDQHDLVSWNDVYALYTLAETRFQVYLPLVLR